MAFLIETLDKPPILIIYRRIQGRPDTPWRQIMRSPTLDSSSCSMRITFGLLREKQYEPIANAPQLTLKTKVYGKRCCILTGEQDEEDGTQEAEISLNEAKIRVKVISAQELGKLRPAYLELITPNR